MLIATLDLDIRPLRNIVINIKRMWWRSLKYFNKKITYFLKRLFLKKNIYFIKVYHPTIVIARGRILTYFLIKKN